MCTIYTKTDTKNLIVCTTSKAKSKAKCTQKAVHKRAGKLGTLTIKQGVKNMSITTEHSEVKPVEVDVEDTTETSDEVETLRKQVAELWNQLKAKDEEIKKLKYENECLEATLDDFETSLKETRQVIRNISKEIEEWI